MSELANAALVQAGSLLTDYLDLWMLPVAVGTVGLVLTVVINALRNKG